MSFARTTDTGILIRQSSLRQGRGTMVPRQVADIIECARTVYFRRPLRPFRSIASRPKTSS
jgi:hypothetical protein